MGLTLAIVTTTYTVFLYKYTVEKHITSTKTLFLNNFLQNIFISPTSVVFKGLITKLCSSLLQGIDKAVI